MKEIKLISEDDKEVFETTLNTHLNEGWKIKKNLQVSINSNLTIFYSILLIKKK